MATRIPHMKYAVTAAAGGKEILANDHYVGVPFCAEKDYAAGDIVTVNERIGLFGVCLYDVIAAENPNGTAVIHGFIAATKLTGEQIAALTSEEGKAALPQIVLVGEPDDVSDGSGK